MQPFTTVDTAMKRYNARVAYGSECSAWQDFVADVYDNFGESPWYVAAKIPLVKDDWADYWFDVAAGRSKDYDAETGARVSQ